MRTSIIATGVTLATAAFAEQEWEDWNCSGGKGSPGSCLNQTGVNYIVEGYTYLLEHPGGPDFNKTATAILSDKFFVSSDSINTLSNRPLDQPAYPRREVFIATQFQTPPLPVVGTLGTFHSCDKISWRWNASGIGSDKYPVKGIIDFDVNPKTLQIDAVYSEFNTAAFQTDLGNPECRR